MTKKIKTIRNPKLYRMGYRWRATDKCGDTFASCGRPFPDKYLGLWGDAGEFLNLPPMPRLGGARWKSSLRRIVK
jgi:hypothetical protein